MANFCGIYEIFICTMQLICIFNIQDESNIIGTVVVGLIILWTGMSCVRIFCNISEKKNNLKIVNLTVDLVRLGKCSF